MDRDKILLAKAEAERFLDRIEAALMEMGDDAYLDAGKHSGAVRRSSMDLSRALAALRGRAL